MPWKTFSSPHIFIASFVGLTLLPGAWAIANAPASGLSADVISGTAQRHYEARFDDSFPMRNTLRQFWAAVKFGTLGEMAEGAVLGRHGVLFTAEEFAVPAAHRNFATALNDAHAQVAAAGGELIPIIVPDKSRMLSAALPHKRSAHFAARYDQLLQIITDAGLRTIDLRTVLSGRDAYMTTDTHWSPSGAQAVATSIGRFLASELDTDAAFVTTRTGMQSFEGDLLAFADTGAWRHLVGPAQEQIATFETLPPRSDGLGLFDEITIPIALVGTSFSAREEFHFQGFLKSALRADVLSFAIEGQGPFVPMERFLKNETPITTAPQIVIWEIPERYLDTWSQDK